MTSLKQTVSAVVLSLLVVAVGTTASASALQSSSSRWGVDETFFGTGGQLCEPGTSGSSTNYCAKSSAGELGVGQSCSPGFCAQVGNNTEREPYLEFVVNPANIDVGVLSTTSTKVATATFYVKNYLSSGYIVVNASSPPMNGSYTLNPLASPTASSTGTEQFGINLVANSCPANTPASGAGSCSGSLGANPVQVPDSSFSYGHAATGYDTANFFKYVNGDTIAYSNQSSGETDYTISYLFNITDTTAGGTFTMNHVLVATATF